MKPEIQQIEDIILEGTEDLGVSGKIGRRLLQPRISEVLKSKGFDVDVEDTRGFLSAGLAVWRDKENGQIAETPGRRRIDLVVRRDDKVVALVEAESDLNDLRETGVSRRSGHYDVFSIARGAEGNWFDSYKSLERMATATFNATGQSIGDLEKVVSDSQAVHNPLGIGVLLVTGSSRSLDRRVLAPRLESLGARLISLVERR